MEGVVTGAIVSLLYSHTGFITYGVSMPTSFSSKCCCCQILSAPLQKCEKLSKETGPYVSLSSQGTPCVH
jgi:hypothetical protein